MICNCCSSTAYRSMVRAISFPSVESVPSGPFRRKCVATSSLTTSGEYVCNCSATQPFVASELLQPEASVRFVVVERLDHIVAIPVSQRTRSIGSVVAVTVGIADHVQPVSPQCSP